MDTNSVRRGSGSGQVADVRLIDIVVDVVRDVAPEELPLLTGLHRFDDAEIGRRLARRTSGDDPLGFGVGEVVVMASPIVFGAVQHVANEIARSAADGFQARVRKLLRRKASKRLPQFGQDDLRHVRDTVLEMARQAGMEQARAEQLAASVVDRLMFHSTADDET